MKTYLIILFCIPCNFVHHTHAWSLSESITDATTKVTHWITKQETQSSIKEYEIPDKASIEVHNHVGNISITTWNKKAIMVEAIKKGTEEQIKNSSFSVTIQDDRVTIATATRLREQKIAIIDFNLIIPKSSPLTIRTETGSIRLYEGVITADVQTDKGSIIIENATQNVIARAPAGSVTIEQQSLPLSGSFFIEAEKDITFILPAQSNTQLSAKTISGKVFSDLFITLDPITTKLNKDAYKRMQREIIGTIGNGGIPITLETISGTIRILES